MKQVTVLDLAKTGALSFIDESDATQRSAFEAHLTIVEAMGRLREASVAEVALCFGVETGNPDALRTAAAQVSNIVRGMETVAEVGDTKPDPVADWLTAPRSELPPRLCYFDGAIRLVPWLTAACQAKVELDAANGERPEEPTGTASASTGFEVTKIERSTNQTARATVPEQVPSVASEGHRTSILLEVGGIYREAWQGLQTRERVLLRLSIVDRIAPFAVAAMYAVPASRVTRWELQAHERFARAASGPLRRLAIARGLSRIEEFVPSALADFEFWLFVHATEEAAMDLASSSNDPLQPRHQAPH